MEDYIIKNSYFSKLINTLEINSVVSNKDFLENIIKNDTSSKLLFLYGEKEDKFMEFIHNEQKIKEFEIDHEKITNLFKNREIPYDKKNLKLVDIDKFPWNKNFFDFIIFKNENINLSFELYQEIFVTLANFLKSKSCLILNYIFFKDKYFINTYENIKKFKAISYADFASSFQYCQIKRLMEPFYEIISYKKDENFEERDQTRWIIYAKKI